jgi:hypothetical protein
MYYDPTWIFDTKPPKKEYPNITGLMPQDKPKKRGFTTLANLSDVFKPHTQLPTSPVALQVPPPAPQSLADRFNDIRNNDSYRAEAANQQQRMRDYQNSLIRLTDRRTQNPGSGLPINPNSDLYTGEYDPNVIRKIIQYSKQYNVDPYELLAIAMQETRLGKASRDESGKLRIEANNPDAARVGNIGHVLNIEDPWMNGYERLAQSLVKSNAEYKDRWKRGRGYTDWPAEQDNLYRLQAYNGTQPLYPTTEQGYHGGIVNAFYGIPVTQDNPLDVMTNPVYGKVITSLANEFKNTPEIQRIYDEVYKLKNK